MYWIFLILFIIAVLVPDLVRRDLYWLPEIRAEEILIFLMGALAFIVYLKKEQQLIFHKKEKEKDKKRIEQTVKDLVESYSYIGEVNRKMDILMNIALGLTDRKVLTQADEKETYASIVSAANFLLKSDVTCLRFVDTKTWHGKKEYCSEGNGNFIKNALLSEMEENVNVKKFKGCLVISSAQEILGVKSYIMMCGYDPEEEKNQKNLEILKVFASQALFLYSYLHNERLSQKANN